jgi:hypothetical protein
MIFDDIDVVGGKSTILFTAMEGMTKIMLLNKMLVILFKTK